MMIHAYDEFFISRAQSLLGDAFDYAINVCKFQPNEFVDMFLVSSYSKRIEMGDSSVIQGRSGIELIADIYLDTTGKELTIEIESRMERTVEYWVGWAIAYYQWYSDRSFSEIFRVFRFEDLQALYYPLHEADISKFVETVDEKIRAYYSEPNIKYLRKLFNLTQAELAEKAGVNLRSIQMYEQQKETINKASFETVYRLSKVLHCSVERLFEK